MNLCVANCRKLSFIIDACKHLFEHACMQARTHQCIATVWFFSVFLLRFYVFFYCHLLLIECSLFLGNKCHYEKRGEKRLSNPFIEWLHRALHAMNGRPYTKHKSSTIESFTLAIIGQCVILFWTKKKRSPFNNIWVQRFKWPCETHQFHFDNLCTFKKLDDFGIAHTSQHQP